MSAGGKTEEEACDGGSKELSHPIHDSTEERDVATYERTKGNCRVDVDT